MKQRLIISAYWTLTVILTATVLSCLYFTFAESLLIGILLLPAGLIVKFTFPRILELPPRRKIADLFLLAVTVCIVACLLLVIGFAMVSDGHYFQEDSYTGVSTLPIPDGIAFPALLTVTAILFSIGDWYLVGFLSRKMPQEPVSITFTSDRKPVTLLQSDILYVESNDDETWVHTIDGRKFRNKTPISQWENLLGMDFMRIHRAFVVAKAHILSVKSDALTLDTKQELPVSRKYRSTIK
ncbi:MAG: LytTR family transcriptional regulator [Bacteroidaceae bacterium]|nr:LytTR family transcriptional regulator [Bacteroidaceae bacterium]